MMVKSKKLGDDALIGFFNEKEFLGAIFDGNDVWVRAPPHLRDRLLDNHDEWWALICAAR